MRTTIKLFCVVLACNIGCDDKAPPPEKTSKPAEEKKAGPKSAAKTVSLGKNVSLEVLPDGTRRVLIPAEVCFREGPLEMFMCRKFTKEHESIVRAEIDGRDLHKALLAAGAVIGSPVKFEPKYEPPKGTKIKVSVRYTQDGKEKTVNARDWVRDLRTKKQLGVDWVFAGSFFYPGPDDDPKKPTQYAGNSGALICVSNFPDATLDVPLESSEFDEERAFEAFTDRIPPIMTKVTIILEPQLDKKEAEKDKKAAPK